MGDGDGEDEGVGLIVGEDAGVAGGVFVAGETELQAPMARISASNGKASIFIATTRLIVSPFFLPWLLFSVPDF